MYNAAVSLENSMMASQRLEIEIPYGPEILLNMSKENENIGSQKTVHKC